MLLHTPFVKRLTCAIIFLFPLIGLSQPITLNQTMTPAQYVQTVLVGSGVTVSNIKYNGSAAAANTVQNTVASFTNSVGGFPMASGVVMTTGNANISPGPNDFSSESTGSGANVTDPDLDALTGSSMQNGAVIEFDFVTTSTNFEFKYIFGSEEYLDFVGSTFNDVFGFFLSGPGISGPYSGGAVNLAVVPGTSTPISINTVNPGSNATYYFDNPIGNGTAYGSSIEYNGTTVLMTVNYDIQCNQTYHMKFAICNVGDKSWDSGVFVKAGSFTAMPDLIAAGPNQTVCGSAGTVVNLTGDAGTLTEHWTTSGTGTFANANSDVTTYTLSAADISAGSVTLTLTGTNPCTGNVVSTTMTITFANPTVTVTPANATICAGSGAIVNLTGTATANTAIRLPRSFTNNTATTIPNNATGINSTVAVTGISPNNLATNAVVSIQVNITHPKSSELTLQLVSPGGTNIPLKVGLSGLGNATTGANMTNTVFRMSAAIPIASGLPPYTGSFIPSGNLNSLTGVINGTWTLKVIDNASGIWDNTTNGSLVNWTINFTTDNYIQTTTWSPTTNMTGSGTLTPTVSPTTTTTYTLTATDGAGCTRTASTTITVNPQTTPTFAAVGPYCSGATIPALPTTSTNGITGTWSPAINNTATTTYTFTPTAGQCATTTTLTINITTPTTPTFTAVGPYCSGATIPALPTTSTNGITGTWSPAINNTTTTTYTFTPTAGQCATTTTLTITINAPTVPTFAAVGPYCSGAAVPALPTTSTNGVTGTWSPAINNTATTTYTFTPTAGLCATTTTLTITINPNTTPTFNPVGPYCSGATIPALPTTSTNSVTGTWSPAINNTTTTTYTFTLCGGCSSPVTLTITINPNITPTFAAVGPYCSGASIPALPTTSTNSITGTWSPAINNTATTTYTFTPSAGQCATTTTLTITINAPTTPTFAAVGPYCSGSTVPALPTTSTNGITGTWSPAINNTATTTYTFTPAAGLCATTTTLTITINAPTTPTFAAVGPYCSGATVPALPTTSTNGVTGTWSPAINNTATTTYTFTPTAGLCATTTTLTITINNNTTPTFNPVGPYCSGATIPVLPTTSTNGVTGTWSPAINNTATTTYTFTPTAGLCATTATLTININNATTPTFNPVGPYCSGSTIPALPTTSTNGINGSWSPAINNTTTTTYTFTPTSGQCATTTTLTINIDATVTPTFTTVPPQCVGDTPPALPTTSNNGITGSWSPSVISTATAGTTSYTFTPDASTCGVPVTVNVTVGPPATPTFNAIAAFCENTTAPTLSSTSLNGFAGTWSPSTVDNMASGTYTFTPNSGQCATSTTMNITVTPRTNPTFNAYPTYCSGSTIPALPGTSTNGITGTWSPAIDNTTTTTYTFTPNSSECANPATMTITISAPVTPTFNTLAAVCQNASAPSLLTTSTNGITGTWSPSAFSTATAGTFTSTFTPDAGQCATTTTLSLTVNALPTITVNSPTTCSNSPVVLNANGAVNYTWTPGTGLSATTGSSVTATVSSTQSYTVIGTDANGCSSSAPSTVTIAAGLSLSVTPNAPSICVGESTSLTASGAVNYVWSPTTTLSASTGATVTATPASTTTYTVNGDDGNGCVGSTTVTVFVNNPTPSTFNTYPSYCSGSAVPSLPTTSNNGISGTWSPAINNTATTTYTFTPTAGQCASSGSMTISINQPTPAQFNPLPPFCQGGTAPVLPATDLNGITGTWSPALVNNQTSAVYTFTPDAGQCATSGSATSTVVSLPVAAFQVSDNELDISSTAVHFFNNSSNADTYSWDFGDGTTSTSTSPDHSYEPTAGDYTITLVATNQFGCSDETQLVITIKEDLFVFVPNTFTPDGDENNNQFFPYVSGDFDENSYTMFIYNRWGETIYETHDVSVGWDGTYHGEYVPQGTYTWTISLKLNSNDAKKTFNGHVNIFR